MGVKVEIVPEQGATIARYYEGDADKHYDTACGSNGAHARSHFAQAIHKYERASYWWGTARAASIGHKRRDRYENAAERCDTMIEDARAQMDAIPVT